MFRLAIVAFAALAVSSSGFANNWPGLHGPKADNVVLGKLPTTWDDKTNVKWKTPIPGRGWSSPVIWGDQVWVTTATPDGKKMSVLCLNRKSGEIERNQLLFENEKPRFCHPMNSYASPTPAIEEGRIYVHFGSYGTACLDTATGKKIWERRDLPCNHFRGPGSSPVIYKDLLICHYDGFDHQYVVAFNKSNGKTKWKVDRKIDYGTKNGDFKKAYSTPLVIRVDGKDQLISATSKACMAYEPATGKEIWRITYRGFSSTARPMFDGERVYINSGFGQTELLAVKPTGNGDVTKTHVVWRSRAGVPRKPSAVLHAGRIYMTNDKGVATCLDAKSGKEIWQSRLGKGEYSSSVMLIGNELIFSNHKGESTVIKTGDEFRRVRTNTLPGGIMSSPAASGNALFLRTKTHLYRIEK